MADMVTMPKLGFDMAEGTLVRWLKSLGEAVNKGDILAEIETDKATVEVECAFSGVILQLLVEAGTSVPIGTPIAIVGQPGEPVVETAGTTPSAKEILPPAEPTVSSTSQARVQESAAGTRIAASPLARRIAQERKVALGGIQGSGPGGRIVRRDVEAALSGVSIREENVLQTSSSPYPALLDERIPLSRLRTVISRRMSESKQQVPHFYLMRDIHVDRLLDLREQMNAGQPDEKKLSINDFLIKAAALTLRDYRNLNASLQGDSITRHGHFHVGVAVAVEGGLMTVVIRNADQKPIPSISKEVRDLAGRARAGKVRPEDIEGSTFSISNLGMFGIEEFIAIINPPECAILAIGASRDVPTIANGLLKLEKRMKITISADHRVTDGAEAAQFLAALAARLEAPLTLVAL